MASVPDFKKKLEDQHTFPSVYMFKFIVPADKESEVRQMLPDGDISSKSSKQGSYVSITANIMVATSDAVIDIYQEANKIEGLIAL